MPFFRILSVSIPHWIPERITEGSSNLNPAIISVLGVSLWKLSNFIFCADKGTLNVRLAGEHLYGK